MQEKFAFLADKFPAWGSNADGMAQHIVWTALEAEGLGANLQHCNPLINRKVAEVWGVPEDWELSAQLVFGTPVAEAGDKTFQNLGERFKVYGA
jgi:predicted oxidoreductase (fatty acid repression mutant protein)